MRQTLSLSYRASSTSVALHLFLSHLSAAALALGVFFWLASTGVQQPLPLLFASVCGGVLGLLLTANLQHGLYVAELALTRLAEGLAVELRRTAWRWPLNPLFGHIVALNQRIKEFTRNERLTTEFRDQLLRQASEAAALEERNRIARDLHDSIKQQIFSISISAAAARVHWQNGPQDAYAAVEDIQRSAKEAQVEMQALLQQLHASPLEHTSLVDALRTQAEALGYRTGAQVHVEIADLPTPDRLPAGAQEAIFRMVQEAFANIARHARAATVWLSLYQKDEALHVEVRDDGQGFAPSTAHKGMGLANLRERAQLLKGDVELQSAPGKGTTVQITLPLLQAPHDQAEQERTALERKKAIGQAQWSFQLGENMAPLAMVLIATNMLPDNFLGFSLIAVVVCALATLFGYIQGHYYMTRVAFMIGKEHSETLSLQKRAQGVRFWLLRICAMGLWYLFISQQRSPFQSPVVGIILPALLTLLAVLFVIERRRSDTTQSRYYRALPALERSWELEQDQHRYLGRFRTWLLACCVGGFSAAPSLTLPLTTLKGRTTYGIVIVLIVWGLFILVDYLHARRIQRLFTEQTSPHHASEMR